MNAWVVIAAIAAYLAVLFHVAWRGDRSPAAKVAPRRRAVIYALTLSIYCTSWTYFGAVGQAARSGWDYLPGYLGPFLAITVLFPLWQRIAVAAKRSNIGSIADFISARYGKSRLLGGLTTVVAVTGALPYIAVQLNSLATSWTVLTGGSSNGPPAGRTVLLIAAALGFFAILFGARRTDLTEHNRGLVRAIAFESLVKLGGMLAVAVLAVSLVLRSNTPLPEALGPLRTPPHIDLRFLVGVLLSGAAFLCLPRQFHMGFVELADPADAREARRTFTIYLIVTALAVAATVMGDAMLPRGDHNPDFFVLELPRHYGGPVLTLFVFIGGFSAATAMVIVELVALSAMISNELILPLARGFDRAAPADFARTILTVRRLAIVGVLFLSWLYFQAIARSESLVFVGFSAFAGLAQLAPALIAGVYWKRGTTAGAITGIAAGFAVWIYTIALPQLGLTQPPTWMGHADPLVVGALWSLSLNIVLFVSVSLSTRPHLIERIQAVAFVEAAAPTAEAPGHALGARVADMRDLVIRVLGEPAAARTFHELSRELDRPMLDNEPVDPALARAVERRLAGAIGATSARGMIAAALSRGANGPNDVTRLLDEAAQAVQFNRELLQAALDNMGQAVSVIDGELRLIAWNNAYLGLFYYPPGLIYPGRPISDVIRWNAQRGECGPGNVEELVRRRLEHLQARTPHTFERLRPDGRIIRAEGAPMPGGGYITTYTDVTEDRRRQASLEAAAAALEEANERLEERVEQRTRELADAKAQAEAATASKTRFLAAASHDLLQPLHAARLFVAALGEALEEADPATRGLARDADRAIASADGLLRALLNLSKLEAGGVKPEVRPVSVGELLTHLQREFEPLAAEKGLRLAIRPCTRWVRSDPDLLRSLLQNLIGNAIRYTEKGGVLVGARRRGKTLEFQVWDTGRGVPQESLNAIFREFTRLGGERVGGMGLGLAIVERVAKLLDHPVSVRSKLGSGSVFAVSAPLAEASGRRASGVVGRQGALTGLRVLCVDNEQTILDSLEALLSRWGAEVDTALSARAAAALPGRWDAALLDYRLREAETGLDLYRLLGTRLGRAALVTAETSTEVLDEAQRLGIPVISKPVQPAALKAFLSATQPLAAE